MATAGGNPYATSPVGVATEQAWAKVVELIRDLDKTLSEQPKDESIVWPLGGIVTYLSVIFLLRLWMRSKPMGCFDKALRWPLVIHNYILCIFSLVLVVGIAHRVVDIFFSCGGLFATYCGCPMTRTNNEFGTEQNRNLMFWAYLFYLSKYYELLDTVFLVLRKRPLNFLHVYHHAIVMPMCWYAINQGIIMGWITCFNNAFVHVIMYYYYAEQARGVGPIWWRKYLTTLQIIQFVVDCGSSVFFGYFYFFGIPCQGTLSAWLCANFVGISFFFLFLDFYRKQYSSKGSKQRKQE